ncbi:MAG: S-layer homology domain-containing protein, partial [Oscillospiraceae bacterium]
MLKKFTSILVVLCMVVALCGVTVFAETSTVVGDEASKIYEDTIPTSGENPAELSGADGHIPNGTTTNSELKLPNGMSIQNPTATNKPIQPRTFDGTNTDGTIDAGHDVNTNLVENSSKYNGMATIPLPATMSRSRYSNNRITLAPDISDTKYAEAAELLGALGIMVGDAENGNFRPNDNILRSEMAKVSVYSIGLEDIVKSSQGPTKFPDVPADSWATGAINVADQQGMVIGDDTGTFRPDDAVLFQEAVTIMVRAMGYEPAAEDKGGYPAGYMFIASSNQLLKGIDATATAPAKRGDIAQLVFNAMTVNLMEQTGFGSNVSYEVVDKTILYDKLNVEKAYGQIIGTGETTLTGGNTTAKDRIQIGENTYLEGTTSAKQYLGYNVLYYARLDKTSDEKTLIVVRDQTNKNNSITVNASNIVAVTGATYTTITIEYWQDKTDKKTKTATIQLKPTYIFNGKFKDTIKIEDLKPKSGNLVLLDSDTNGTYDIVFVNHFTNLVVDTISSVTGRVTDKYLNGSIVFDPNNTEITYSIIKDGAEISLSDLTEWNVISYTVSEDKNLIKAYVSDASIKGTVTEISSKGYRIGDTDKAYEKAESYPNTIALRDKGTFYLDVEEKIAAVNTKGGEGQTTVANYAFLIGTAMGDNFDKTAKFKLFSKTGETSIISSTAKMRLNAKYGMEPSDVVAELVGDNGKVTPQLVVYETNSEGKITALELAADKTSTGEPNIDTFSLNMKGEDVIYKSASSKLGSVTVNEDTVIFDIPASAGEDTDKYSIRNKSTLSNDSAYDVFVYDLQENYTANAVVITSSTGATAPESAITVVDHVSETQNESFEYTDKLYGFQGGKEVSIMAIDKTILVDSKGKKLKTG